jgi:DNA ligase-1
MSAGWITKLNESNSKIHKEDVLSQALELSLLGGSSADTFLSLVQACYNPMITFGVKQVPETVGITTAENPWTEFNELLDSLRLRKLTGHAARDAIEAMSLRFDSDEWNLMCAAVLRKDLRCGISDKTFNKVCKKTKYEVPVFSCQLATNCEGRPEMVGEQRIEPKLDGVRVLMLCAIQEDGTTMAVSYSRNGKVFDNFGHIESQICNQMAEISARLPMMPTTTSFFLDGEVVGKSFNELMRVARKKDGAAAASDSVFHVFDFIPTVDFNRGHWNAQLEKRLRYLDKIKPCIDKMPNVEYPDHIIVNLDTSEGKNQLNRYAQDCVKDGYEGIMIKAMGAPYECRRSTFWLKWKPVITVDLQIREVEIGTGKNSDRMGAFVCEGVDNDKLITVNVGSGVTDEERIEYWDNRDSLIGRTVEIMCDAVSQNQDGTYSLRFPRFVRFRDTLTGEKE